MFWKVVSPEMRWPDTFHVVWFQESIYVQEREWICLSLLLYSESPSQQLEVPQDFAKTYIYKWRWYFNKLQMSEVKEVEGKNKVLMEIINAWNK